MLERGDIVEATVKHTAVFGLFCEAGSTDILVRIPELSWIASFNSAEQFAAVGDSIRAKIVVADKKGGQVSASVRAIHPDPWEDDELEVGQTFTATVFRRVPCADRCREGPGYLMEIVPGGFAMLCETLPLKVGEAYPVEIVESSRQRHSVKLVLGS